MHLSQTSFTTWLQQPLRNLPNAITAGDYVPYSNSNWPQCVFKSMFFACGNEKGLLLAADPLSGLQASCLCLNRLVNSVYTITLFPDYENLLLSKALCCCIPSDNSQAISVM